MSDMASAYLAENCKTVIVTSCKGGVGKSTVTANLAYALAKRGKRTLALDCDFSNRSLDLIFGHENSVIYDICDVIYGRAEIEDAVIKDGRSENLFFCPAPLEKEEDFSSEAFYEALEKAKEKFELDFIIIDTPGASGGIVEMVAERADEALIVVSHQPTATRAAERTGMMLDSMGVKEQRLIVNAFDADAVSKELRLGVNELIDKTRTRIIGIVPQDYELSLSQEYGMLCAQIDNKNMKRIAVAFDNIAARLCSASVPLLRKVYGTKKRRELLEK